MKTCAEYSLHCSIGAALNFCPLIIRRNAPSCAHVLSCTEYRIFIYTMRINGTHSLGRLYIYAAHATSFGFKTFLILHISFVIYRSLPLRPNELQRCTKMVWTKYLRHDFSTNFIVLIPSLFAETQNQLWWWFCVYERRSRFSRSMRKVISETM